MADDHNDSALKMQGSGVESRQLTYAGWLIRMYTWCFSIADAPQELKYWDKFREKYYKKYFSTV